MSQTGTVLPSATAPPAERRDRFYAGSRWLASARSRVFGLTIHQVLSLASVALCLAVMLAMFVFSDGVPYVVDGNESFSTYNHAANLLRFGPAATMGLTDEASTFAPAAAHPYVYTHQGNMPRIAAYILLLLRVQPLILNVAAISLIAGTAATALCFRFFARAATPVFAAIVCLVLWTDYLMFVQWQVNSYRVWHAFFLFAGLVCAQAIGSRRRWPPLCLIAVVMGLFYFEFIYAVFASVLIAGYSIIHYHRSLRQAVAVCGLLAAGSALSIGAFVMQLVAFLGVDYVVKDIQATYFARNFAADIGAAAARAQVVRFFMENHVTFWDAFDATPYHSISAFARTVTSTVLVVYGPPLVTVVGSVVLGLVFATLAAHRFRMPRALMRVAPPSRLSQTGRVSLNRSAIRALRWRRWSAAGLVAMAIAGWIGIQGALYPVRSASLWRDYIQGALPTIPLLACFFAAWLLGTVVALRRTRGLRKIAESNPVSAALQYLAAGSVAFLFVYYFSPGYLYGGYLSHYVPLAVFITDVAIALAVYCLVQLLGQHLSTLKTRRRARLREVVIPGLAAALLLFVAFYWARLQFTYVSFLPPDGAKVLRRLGAPEFAGTGTISNNYALPIALTTQGWAFQDEVFPQRKPLDVDGREIAISGKYMWFADRDTNPDYLHPTYYVCRADRNLDTVADLLALAPGDRLTRCSGQPIVQRAMQGPDRLIDTDQSPADGWVIVALSPNLHLHPTWRESTPEPNALGYVFASGFYGSEGGNAPLPRWTSGRGVLEVYSERRGGMVLSLDLVQPDFGVRRQLPDLTVSANGVAIKPERWIVTQPTPGHYSVRLPIVVPRVGDGKVIVTLQSATFVPAELEPGSVDQRQLGLRLEAIKVEGGG